MSPILNTEREEKSALADREPVWRNPFPIPIYVPYDPGAGWYETEGWNGGGDAEAWEYTGWRDETMSWKTTCYIDGHLNPTPRSP